MLFDSAVFHTLSTATVITNSCLIGFVGSQVAGFVVKQGITFEGEELDSTQATSFIGTTPISQTPGLYCAKSS